MTCKECGHDFLPLSKRQKYCSRQCSGKVVGRDGRVKRALTEISCEYCTEIFASVNSSRRFCSMRCSNKSRVTQRPTTSCASCGITIVPKFPSQPRKYCSLKCSAEGLRVDKLRDRSGDLKLSAKALRELRTQLLLDQNGKCKICATDIAARPVVDHDHRTGEVRALLCGTCNSGIGMFKDDPALLEAAIQYLRSFSCVSL